MPNLISFAGLSMVRGYVRNWYSVAAVYLHLRQSIVAEFRNGDKIFLSRKEFHDFHESLFQRYLKDNGFRYSTLDGHALITTNTGSKLILLPDYSNVIEEIYLRKEYGEQPLHGRTVIDIGASIADSALYFAGLGAEKVYAFEINPVRLELAKKNVNINDKSTTIEVLDRSATSKEISALIKANSLNGVFMKIDCDGCEYELIDNLAKSEFDCIDDIVLEYTYGEKGISRKLKDLGYHVKHKRRLLLKIGYIYATKKSKGIT